MAGIRKSGSRETETPLEELAVKDSINAIHKAQVRPPMPFEGRQMDSRDVLTQAGPREC